MCEVRAVLPARRAPQSTALLVLVVLAACAGSRTIPTKAHPKGEEIACVGVSGKGKQVGIDYDLSARNLFWGIVGFEFIYPPIKVAVSETFCPVSDTTMTHP